jgi:transcription elongation factor Elf1
MHNQNSFKDKQIKYTTYINNNKNSVSTTLDIKHQEKVKEFESYDEQLKKKNSQYKKYLKQLDELNNIKSSDLTIEITQKKATLKNEIDSIKFDIDKLKNRTDEINYYEDTIDILLEYYNANNPNLYQDQASIPVQSKLTTAQTTTYTTSSSRPRRPSPPQPKRPSITTTTAAATITTTSTRSIATTTTTTTTSIILMKTI